MWQVVVAILQIIYLVMKNSFEKDAQKRKQKEEMYVEAKEAVKSRDPSRIVGVVDRLRNV